MVSVTSSGRSSPESIQSPCPSVRAELRPSSCSSAISPTISSTTSSRVTTPAVPPYSSTTTPSCSPSSRSRSIRSSIGTDAGTRVAGTARSRARVEVRRGAGTPIACLTWTTPSIASKLLPITGKRERPLCRASSRMSAAESVESTVCIRTRGVMIAPAVRLPKSRARSTRSAVPRSRVPCEAERRTAEASSPGPREDASSSCGSMPSARTTTFAEPFRPRIGSAIAAVNGRCTRCTTAATARGRAMARFLGTISPSTMWK